MIQQLNNKKTMFKKINFSIDIAAPKEKVWDVLWQDKTYRMWTKVFNEESHAVSDWKEGSAIQFLDGNGNGMSSRIAVMKPNDFISFEHLGIIKNGIEQPQDEQTKSWSGSKEEYTLKGQGDQTTLEVSLDSDNEFAGYFSKTFPVALQKVKELSEA